MAGGRPKAVKKQKIGNETIEQLENMEIQIDGREDQLIFNDRRAVREVLRAAYKRDLATFFNKNPELGLTSLLDYAQIKPGKENAKEIAGKEVKKEEGEEKEAGMHPPSVIRPKKTAFRHPRPNEIVFSANGTPISLDQHPKSFVRNFTAVAQMTEVLSTPGTRTVSIAMEELSEMD